MSRNSYSPNAMPDALKQVTAGGHVSVWGRRNEATRNGSGVWPGLGQELRLGLQNVAQEAGPVGSSSAMPDAPNKQEALDQLCRIIGIEQATLGVGSSIPSHVFTAAANLVGVNPNQSMPEIGEEIVTLAGLNWDDDCDSRGTDSGGGSTVTLVGMNRLVAALEILSGDRVADGIAREELPEDRLEALGWDFDEGAAPGSEVDARERILGSIVCRRGQGVFRQNLLNAYEGTCAITGTTAPEALDAAHIRPYRGVHTNQTNNGLLLRGDIHTLFDLGLISVEPDTRRVWVSPGIQDPDYRALNGIEIRVPNEADALPSSESLAWHFTRRRQ